MCWQIIHCQLSFFWLTWMTLCLVDIIYENAIEEWKKNKDFSIKNALSLFKKPAYQFINIYFVVYNVRFFLNSLIKIYNQKTKLPIYVWE